MKVLFVGEGPHDVGPPSFAPEVRAASGVIPTLARRVCPQIGDDSVSIFWREVPVLPSKQKRMKGWSAKVRSSIALAIKHACVATVCVADRDRDDDRLGAMEEGVQEARGATDGNHHAICGLAIESVEAWVLGAPTALASVVGVDRTAVLAHYRPSEVETLYQGSEKEEKRPKDILGKVAGRTASTELRQRVAEWAEVAELERHCPQGFKPFAEKLRAVFGPRP